MPVPKVDGEKVIPLSPHKYIKEEFGSTKPPFLEATPDMVDNAEICTWSFPETVA